MATENQKESEDDALDCSKTQETIVCFLCSTSFTTIISYKQHAKYSCAVSGQTKKALCKFCGKIFRSRESLSNHKTKMHRDLNCELCDRTFTSIHWLNSHRTIEHEGKSHQCDVCGKRVLTWASLRSHRMRFHMTTQSCVGKNW